jgi:uncharacterized protein YndB with AHSA1/START domain
MSRTGAQLPSKNESPKGRLLPYNTTARLCDIIQAKSIVIIILFITRDLNPRHDIEPFAIMSDGINIVRTFAASRERVFEAWTTPEQFSFWFGGEAITVPQGTVKMDVRPGGSWAAVMQLPDGTLKSWAGDYIAVDPPAKLVLTITDDVTSPNRERITVVLAKAEEGTEMTMTQKGGNLAADRYHAATVGYNTFFDAMEKLFV